MESNETPETTLAQRLAAVEKQLADLKVQPVPSPMKVVGELEPLSPIDQKVETKNEDAQPKSRVKLIISKTDPETGEIVQDDSKVLKTNDKDEDRDRYAFALRKMVQDNDNSRQISSEIDIINLDLWALLKERLSYYPYHLYRDSPVTLWSPYESLVFEFDALMAMSQVEPTSDTDKRAREDLKLLLDTISGGSSGDERLDKYFKARQNYKKQKPETVQFEDLWTVFQPGTLVYGQPFQGQPQVFVVKDNFRPWPWQRPDKKARGGTRPDTWELDAWSYDWRDGSFSRCLFVLNFDHFEGHLPLTSLPYYPFELHPEYEAKRAELIARGRDFRKICEAKQGSRLFDYRGRSVIEKKGLAVARQDDDSFDGDTASSYMIGSQVGHNHNGATVLAPRSSEVKSRVMVDYESYFEYGGANVRNGPLTAVDSEECLCFDCQQNTGLCARYRTHFDQARFVLQKEWEEEQYLICPPRVLGYILKDKQWAQLQVTLLSPLSQYDDDELLSRLKLADDPTDTSSKKEKDESTKALLLDLVRSHTSTEVKTEAEDEERLNVDDIIPDKGKGLIILLYGPPGVGKTSTAEAIAIATGKALFSVSVADVGTQAKHVESNLARIFALATKWQAILLIDEADVFLESRGRGNKAISTEKNALVSVFLRVLEYYQGIMFLTTNQIAEFDVAIPSRIHLAIKYESLKKSQMEAIFYSFLDPLEDKRLISDYEEIKEWLDDVVYKEHFDGRQIRNMVTTALGLARAEAAQGKGKKQLTKSHMKRAFKNMSTFKRDFNIQMQRYIDGQEKMIK
ncbi:uncharacterized protein FIESC28_08796 [Fusarium coffeatum]|uniref:AAA+ ATPase domain-containing protein n=1 Tax=Fusarium coffeatum TaxID=231269 RepID=A0A366R430_9HYPO|nr:uncharacterized protein FIESC28_08796 [Fusarium coffeatum]RBR11911.1 hypothetical protein FIESC28_08796 [Fusarium coffeatum]